MTLHRYAWTLAILAGCPDPGPALPDGAPTPDATASTCPPAQGPGTVHAGGTVAAPEVWTAAGSPHDVPADTSIYAELRVEPCAIVRIAGDRTITVRAGGALVAAGAPGAPVTIERLDPADSWSAIRVHSGGTLDLEHAIVAGGGDPLNTMPDLAAAVMVAGTTPATAPIARAVEVTIRDSESQGLRLHDGGGLTADSTGLRITGSGGYPVHAWARALSTLPDGDYTGNALDEILVTGSGPGAVREDTTIHARGVPYRIGSPTLGADLDVGDVTGLVTLTIEPGVALRFPTAGRLRVEPGVGYTPARAALIAVGTPAAPIVLTSAAATPAAGDWHGLWFGSRVAPTSRVQHVRVEYAGRIGSSGSDSCVYPGQPAPNEAAIRILGSAEPGTVFVTDTTIVASARHGIDRGFRSDVKPDFLPTNTFVDVAGCLQSYPRDLTGACPAAPPCP
jgi:hypothetical protein